ncbi:MAG: VPLPA-CTERM sorting domain-containing protein [Syntrophobacteraceae bacterium]|nr:VPLPA-CTERM sorting domain-containing protein [Syntrophobacteraceae bacterium]
MINLIGLSLGSWGSSQAALTRTSIVNLPTHLPQVQVEASSVLGGFSAQNIQDGRPGTRWDSGVAASLANPQWVVLDLGGIHEIARVNLLGPTPGQRKFYSVSVSADNESWTRVLPRGKAVAGLEGVAGGEAVRISNREPILAQYIKYEVFGGSGKHTARLGEMKILGNPNAQMEQVPVPASIWLMGSGLAMLAGMRRTRRQAGLA